MNAEEWGRGVRVRVTVPEAVKALVDLRQGGRYCVDCRRYGLVPPPEEPLELDHLQPLAEGGDNHWSNLAWRCRSHNLGKGTRPHPRAAVAERPAWLRRRAARELER